MGMVVQNLTDLRTLLRSKRIPAIVPTRVNVKQLKTENYLEEFRAGEATAMVNTRATGITNDKNSDGNLSDDGSRSDGGDSTSDLSRDAS